MIHYMLDQTSNLRLHCLNVINKIIETRKIDLSIIMTELFPDIIDHISSIKEEEDSDGIEYLISFLEKIILKA